MKKKSQLDESNEVIARAKKLGIERAPTNETRTQAQILKDEAESLHAEPIIEQPTPTRSEIYDDELFFNVNIVHTEVKGAIMISINGSEPRKIIPGKSMKVNVRSLAKFLDRSSEDAIAKTQYEQEEKYGELVVKLMRIDSRGAQRVCEYFATSPIIGMFQFVELSGSKSKQLSIAAALQKAQLIEFGTHGWRRRRHIAEQYAELPVTIFEICAAILQRHLS